MLSQCTRTAKGQPGEPHSLPVHVMKGVKQERGSGEEETVHVFVTHLPERWVQRNKMEKVNVILADEGIFHDIYTQQGFSPWENPHNTRLRSR